jgi:hypothetical protein
MSSTETRKCLKEPMIKERGTMAVITGICVNAGGYILGSSLSVIAFAAYVMLQEMTPNEMEKFVFKYYSNVENWLYIFDVIAGTFPSFLGGFLYSRITPNSRFRVGFILACISALLIFAINAAHFSFLPNPSLLKNTIVTVLVFAFVLFGVKYGKR